MKKTETAWAVYDRKEDEIVVDICGDKITNPKRSKLFGRVKNYNTICGKKNRFKTVKVTISYEV